MQVSAFINIFDIVVIMVIALSMLLAWVRGFLKEMLSLFAWVGAAVFTIYYFPAVSKSLEGTISNKMVAGGFAALGTYMISLIALTLLSSLILRYVKNSSDVGAIDKILGVGFGFMRGFLIVSLGFLLFTFFQDEKTYPKWVKEANTRGAVEWGALAIAHLAPSYMTEMSALKERIEEQKEAAEKKLLEIDEIAPPEESI